MTVQQSSDPKSTGPDAPVWMLMTRAVARISPDARLDEVARKLAAVEVGALAVGTTTSIVGITSERDVTRAYGQAKEPEGMHASDIASSDLIWCDPNATAAEAAKVMADHDVRHLLVGDDTSGDLQGIISSRPLLKALVS